LNSIKLNGSNPTGVRQSGQIEKCFGSYILILAETLIPILLAQRRHLNQVKKGLQRNDE
jgi:hypothetical protein